MNARDRMHGLAVLRRHGFSETFMLATARLLIAISCLAFVVGCHEPPPQPPAETVPAPTLLIGLIPEQDVFKQIERYEPLAAYLSANTGTRVTLRMLPRYGNIIDNFTSSGLDGAFFGSFTYALAHRKLDVTVTARPVALDGTSTYHGLIFVRKDSGIETIAQMAGKRFVFVDKATTAGYLLPLDFFSENGVDDYKTFLSESYFAGTHESAIHDVLNGKADIGAAKNTVFDRLAKDDERIESELVIVMRSPDVPENALALRGDMQPALKHLLKQTLLAMDEDPEGQEILRRFGALEFVETTDEDYEPVYRYAEHIGLDLPTYDYMND
jgi:phosphonate transport system substrate-binding protein